MKFLSKKRSLLSDKGFWNIINSTVKAYWAPRLIKLSEKIAEGMQAEKVADAVQELHTRFDTAIMVEAVKDRSLYITEANAPMIFFRYLPSDQTPLKAPF